MPRPQQHLTTPEAVAPARRRRGASVQRQPTNPALDVALVAEAKELGVNVSQVAELGVNDADKKSRAERWTEENREAISAWNDYVEKHGLPLAKHWNF